MELKCYLPERIPLSSPRSNRTFMELKYCHHHLRSERQSCSNRTFMELKFLTSHFEIAKQVF